MKKKKKLTIAIDFDETFTADPILWASFMYECRLKGYTVCIVTARRCTDDNQEIIKNAMQTRYPIKDCKVYFTSLKSKLEYMKKIGVNVDIWIDDDPETLVRGH